MDFDTIQRLLGLLNERAIIAIYDDLCGILDYPGSLPDDRPAAKNLVELIEQYCQDTYLVDNMAELREMYAPQPDIVFDALVRLYRLVSPAPLPFTASDSPERVIQWIEAAIRITGVIE